MTASSLSHLILDIGRAHPFVQQGFDLWSPTWARAFAETEAFTRQGKTTQKALANAWLYLLYEEACCIHGDSEVTAAFIDRLFMQRDWVRTAVQHGSANLLPDLLPRDTIPLHPRTLLCKRASNEFAVDLLHTLWFGTATQARNDVKYLQALESKEYQYVKHYPLVLGLELYSWALASSVPSQELHNLQHELACAMVVAGAAAVPMPGWQDATFTTWYQYGQLLGGHASPTAPATQQLRTWLYQQSAKTIDCATHSIIGSDPSTPSAEKDEHVDKTLQYWLDIPSDIWLTGAALGLSRSDVIAYVCQWKHKTQQASSMVTLPTTLASDT